MIYNKRFTAKCVIQCLGITGGIDGFELVHDVDPTKEPHIFGCKYIPENDTVIISYKLLRKE